MGYQTTHPTDLCACFTASCADFTLEEGSDAVALLEAARMTEVPCPDPAELPHEFTMYGAAVGHAIFVIASAVFTYQSRNASNQEMSVVRTIFGKVLVAAYPGKASGLNLVPDNFD